MSQTILPSNNSPLMHALARLIQEHTSTEDVAFIDVFGQLGVDAHDDVFNQAGVHGLVHCPQEGAGNGFLDNLCGADCHLKCQHWIAGAGAVAPNPETVFTDQGGYISVVEGVGITVFIQ